MKRASTLLGAMLVAAAVLAISPSVSAGDRLGSKWVGCEYGPTCEWKFEWRRVKRGSNVFNAYWRHAKHPKLQAKITISISGTKVVVSRPAFGGNPACTYTGTYKKRDVHNGIPARVSGTVKCGPHPAQPWRATITN